MFLINYNINHIQFLISMNAILAWYIHLMLQSILRRNSEQQSFCDFFLPVPQRNQYYSISLES